MRLITALGFIRLGFGTLVEHGSWGQGIVDEGINSAWWVGVLRPSHNSKWKWASRDESGHRRDKPELGRKPRSDERLRARRARQSHLSHNNLNSHGIVSYDNGHEPRKTSSFESS